MNMTIRVDVKYPDNPWMEVGTFTLDDAYDWYGRIMFPLNSMVQTSCVSIGGLLIECRMTRIH